jgi:hypothetical protein
MDTLPRMVACMMNRRQSLLVLSLDRSLCDDRAHGCRENNSLALQLWSAQTLLNFSWSPVFFRRHKMDLGFAIILTLLATIVGFVAVQIRENRLATGLFVPSHHGSPSRPP